MFNWLINPIAPLSCTSAMDSLQWSKQAKRRLWDREHCPCCVSGVSQKFYFLHFSLQTVRTEGKLQSLLRSLNFPLGSCCLRVPEMWCWWVLQWLLAELCGLGCWHHLFWLFQRGELILCCRCIPFANFVKLHTLPFSVLFTVLVTRMGYCNFNAQYSLWKTINI